MYEYRGYVITPAVPYFRGLAEVPCVTYSVLKGKTLVRNAIVHGPFNKLEDAFSAAEVDACGWIDRQ
jgi:hypothetical protein